MFKNLKDGVIKNEKKTRKIIDIIEILSWILGGCSIILSIILLIISDLEIGTSFGIIISIIIIVAAILISLIFIIGFYKAKRNKEKELDNYYNRIRESVGLPYKSYYGRDKIITEFYKAKETLNLINESQKEFPAKEQVKVEISERRGKDILGLMADSMTEIREYYLLSKSQAKFSFIFAILMSVFGFLLIAASIILAIIFRENLTATVISAIGAVVVELLSATFLYVYKKSLEQLNHYYSQLHENEKFLSAVNLVTYIGNDKQDDVYIEIIRSRLINEEILQKNK